MEMSSSLEDPGNTYPAKQLANIGISEDGSPAVISLNGVSKIFPNGTSAVDDFTLEIRQGEFVSLLGPSGCGKSTVLRLISGLMEPSSGAVELSGQCPADHSNELGFVFQEPTLMPWTTVFGNIWLPLRLKGVSKRDAYDKIMNALEMVGLQDFAAHAPSELSGGMKMRVSIARALVTRPRILLMDEPFAALDEITRFKLNNDLLELWSTFGWTVVFVTHSVFESVYLSNRIVVMASRSGGIVVDKSIKVPYPRGNQFRTSSTYQAECQAISEKLQEAIDIRGVL